MFLWSLQAILSAVISVVISIIANTFISYQKTSSCGPVSISEQQKIKKDYIKGFYIFMTSGIIFFALGFLVEIFDANRALVELFEQTFNNKMLPSYFLSSVFFFFAFIGFTNGYTFFRQSVNYLEQTHSNDKSGANGSEKR